VHGPARQLDPTETPDEIRRFESACAAAAQELDARIARATERLMRMKTAGEIRDCLAEETDKLMLHSHVKF